MRYVARVGLLMGLLVLESCKTVGGSRAELSGVSSGQDRAREIHAEITGALKREIGSENGKMWSDTRGDLAEDWIVQSPEGYWGKNSDELPKNLGCIKGSANCDADFERRLCSTDDDCSDLNASCRLLEASATPTKQARKMCLGSGDSLLDRYYKVMVSADKHLEITTLSAPTGRFRTMMLNALAILMKKPNPPSVRIAYSGRDVLNVNILNPAQTVLRRLYYDIGKVAGISEQDIRAEDDRKAIRMPMNLAYITDGTLSWNHSKIVVADQTRVLQGGHNMWDPDYLSETPVADLSMETTGPVAKASQNFANRLWETVDSESKSAQLAGWSFGELPQRVFPLQKDAEKIIDKIGGLFGQGNGGDPSKPVLLSSYRLTPPDLQPKSTGSVAMIAVGRLGRLGGNASDTALKAMIRSAKLSLDFAIQDMYQVISKPWVMDEITDAVVRGVRLRVVQSDSNPWPPGGYVQTEHKVAHALLLKEIMVAAQAKGLSRDFVCEHVEYAPWRYTAGQTSWINSKVGIGSHPKLMIVDDSAFYMGSHNFYPSNLQEFGIIVSDARVTMDLQDKYWDKVWTASYPDKVPCN